MGRQGVPRVRGGREGGPMTDVHLRAIRDWGGVTCMCRRCRPHGRRERRVHHKRARQKLKAALRWEDR